MSLESPTSADRLIDERLPNGSDPARKDQIVPEVDQQGPVDDRLDVLRSTLAKHHGAETVGIADGLPREVRVSPPFRSRTR